MSWFSELAGKAEDLLNRVDQGAATALSKKENAGNVTYSNSHLDAVSEFPTLHQQTREQQYQVSSKSSFISSAADNIKHQKATILAGTANVKAASRTSMEMSSSAEAVSTSRPSSQFVRRKKSEPNDELLFDFLNSSEKEPNGRMDLKREKSRAAVAQNHSRTSSISSVSASSQSVKTGEDVSIRTQDNDTPDSSSSGLETDVDAKKDSPESAEANPSLTPNDSKSHELSNLRLENQLLRNEVQSLNQEMASLIQRAKETQTELSNARARVEKWNADNSNNDRLVRELQAQVDDLTEAAAAKDSQLAVLKVRLQEADQLLNSRTEALESLQNEKTRIIQDNSEGNSLHNQALQTLQERLHDAESALRREQEGYKQMQNEFAARLGKMEAERQNLAEAVTTAERKYVEEKRKADESQQQVKVAKTNLETAKQELVDYKQKATRILQSKEKLINSLKEGSGIEGLDSQTASLMELEELRHERDMQKEEMQKLWGQIQQLRAELQDMEAQQINEAESTREQIQDLQDQIATHKTAKQEVEAELERQKQELRYTEEELYRTKNTLQSRISDREEEIQKLRNQLTNKTLSSSSQLELENRLHQLTETLIQKQTMLESLSTEKNSLVYQLERLEQQLKTVQGPSTNGPSINMAGIDTGEGARMRNVPVLFGDIDVNVAGMYGRVRKAASSIDQFSIRLGIFLRRYPIARVFVIIYMALLHLWVMIVLLTYTPEMHHDNPNGK
ncbi:golgin subfamily A member 5 [Hemicordylus capensis]|uniref:golgin subfamily A member 5 n=1 Tax=Hemicordylus capensis TaxID=884348 RepID=UPI00230482C9|nr:golgin subfamily A member 5 [Hemicordylus capensis]XP_053124578.1 golgin subfamily A member 5 [Hemicordylus capensis]XP_053124587.1 golgin subfamily A member 5 [Hemicordylus capensis]XP_053124598.1 golgin subfamily A member 5 [Hemicordylus capensis]XP_053124605.1 golgin subfamily A member 5 [Hemicordylus capensis]